MEFWVVFFPPSPSNCKIFQLKIDSQITQTCCYFLMHWRTNGKIQKIMLAASKKMFEFNTNLFCASLFFCLSAGKFGEILGCWLRATVVGGLLCLSAKPNGFFAKNISLLQQISKFCSKDECLCAKLRWILLDLRTIYFACDIETRNLPFFCLKFHVILAVAISSVGWLV